MVNTIEKLHQLLELAEDIGGKQFRADVVSLVIGPRCAPVPPLSLNLAARHCHGLLSMAWLREQIDDQEANYGRLVTQLLVTRKQLRQIADLLWSRDLQRARWPEAPTHFDGIPLSVVAP